MKFAYLIMAHEQPALLQKLLKVLDDARNDIYLHIDKKAVGFDEAALRACCRRASLTFVARMDVRWGGYSLIDCELALVRQAAKTPHDFYHLLSGTDLPLQQQDAIHAFFEAHPDTEFVGVIEGWAQTPPIRERYAKYHWLSQRAGRNRTGLCGFLYGGSMAVQRRIPFLDRTHRQTVEFYGGSNWFSITQAFADYVLSRTEWVRHTFHATTCCDEIFMQTLLLNSPFAPHRFCPGAENGVRADYAACRRKIDWERGNPYIWTEAELPELLSCGMCFARKFSLATPEEATAVETVCRAALPSGEDLAAL